MNSLKIYLHKLCSCTSLYRESDVTLLAKSALEGAFFFSFGLAQKA